MGIELYRHQKVELAHLRLNDSFAIFAEQGTGKTLPILFRLLELIKSGRVQRALIVCPKAVMGSWQRDMEKFDPDDRVMLRNHISVINYDRIWRKSADDYREKCWDAIVLDESHKIKCHTRNRSRCLLEMATTARYRYILTGTPISNGQLENIWSQFAFLAPRLGRKNPKNGRPTIESVIFGGTYYQWLDRYAFLDKYHKPYRYRRVDELQEIIADHSYRVLKSECLDLPDKLPDEIYDIHLPKDSAALYKEMHEESVIEDMDVLAKNPLSRLLRMRQICSGWVAAPDGITDIPCEKVEALDDFLDGWEKKLVIFAEFKRSIDTICALLEKRKIRYVVLDGRQKDKTVWKQFQTDKIVRVIVCQYQSANAGIDLFAADTMLFFEPTLSSNVLEQAKDRIHRIGQHRPCSYIHFLTVGSVEKAIYRALQNYADFNEKLFSEYMEEYQKGWNNG